MLLAAWVCPARAEEDVHKFHRDGVLGTSFDLRVRGTSEADAQAAEKAVLAEIERLAKVLWTGDPKSEISRLMAAKGEFACSEDLWAVMRDCSLWRTRTGGAFNANLGQLEDLWQQAASDGRAPSATQIRAAMSALRGPAWRLSARTVHPLRPLHLRVAGLAKGYIADRALAVARGKAPGATGILVNLGGDIAARGAGPAEKTGWLVDVADPREPAENDRPLTTIRVAGRAVASSGGYARSVTIAGKRHSHILNPLTGRPAEGIAGATVVAPDAASADAAATALCVLSPARGLGLVNLLRDVECVIVDTTGTQHVSRGWRNLVVDRPGGGAKPGAGEQPVASEGKWPKDYGVRIHVALRQHRKRPLLAAWVADKNGRPVKMLALWGKTKYSRKLSTFCRLDGSFRDSARSVTRASPRAGVYALAWDGTDGTGKQVRPGAYTVNIEIVREKGTHVTMTGTVHCGTEKVASARMRPNAESDGAEVKYGPRGT